jgi:hypothetical protein
VRYVFNLFDTDGSGFLDQQELEFVLEQLSVPASQAEFERAVEWVDKDNTGTLNVDEFIVLFTFLESGAFPAGHEPPDDWWEGIETTWYNPSGDALDEAMEVDGAREPGSGDAEGSPVGGRRMNRTAVQNAVRSVTKLAMQGVGYWKLFVAQNSAHHYLARRVLTREAMLASAAQVWLTRDALRCTEG